MAKLGLPGRTGSLNKNTELGALNEIIRKLIELKSSLSGGGGGSATLAEQILQTIQLTAINGKIITDTDDGVVATDQVVPLNMSILYAEGDGVEVRLKTDYSVDNRLLVSSVLTGSLPLPTGAATEATLNLVDSSLAAINTDIQLTNIELGNILSAFNAEDFASQTTLAALLTELQLKADLTETQPVSVIQSNLSKLKQEANDLVKTFTYLDAGLADERVSTIVYSSIALALTVTKTFVYAGSTPNFRVSTITLS